jgi:hypothetical protein
MLPPLGILFALFVAFTASEVWGNIERANAAIAREASALKSVLVLAASFPGEPEARLHALIHRYIEKAVTVEWPSMGRQSSTLAVTPRPLAEALQATLAITPHNPGQEIAQRAIADALAIAMPILRTGPDVAAARADREENHDPGGRCKRS